MLPSRMELAVEQEVLSQEEAEELVELALLSPHPIMPVPEHLRPAARRLNLWLMEPPTASLH